MENNSYNYSAFFDTNVPIEFEYKLWQKIIFSFFMFPIMFLSIVGNILVVVAICKYHFLRITNNIFLASLALADLSIGILAMPPNAIQILTGRWYLKSTLCRFWFVSDVLFSTSSILHLCCVSIDRYLSISDKFAFNYKAEHPTKSWRVRIMIFSVWITSALLSFVPIFTNLYTTDEQAKIIDRLDYENGQCNFIVNRTYRFISSSVSFWVPGSIMIIFYTMVMIKAYRIENREFKMYKNIKYKASVNSDLKETTLLPVNYSNSNTLTVNYGENGRNYSLGSQNIPYHKKHSNKRNSSDTVRLWKREYKVNMIVLTFL
jgi:hypothetical protein